MISDIVENIGTKKVFTKIDLRWKYNIDKGRRQVESGIYHTKRVIWTDGNILQTYELTSNILDYNEQTLMRSYQYWKSSELYKQCDYRNRDKRGA